MIKVEVTFQVKTGTVKIEKLETEQKQIYALLTDVSFYQKDPKDIAATKARLKAIDDELQAAYQRWEFLENLQE